MIIRPTAQLAKRIKVKLQVSLPLAEDPVTDWSGRIITHNRVPYIMMTNSPSLYTVVFPARGANDAESLREKFYHSLLDYGMHSDFGQQLFERVRRSGDNPEFSKSLNRSVIGSMNDMKLHACHLLSICPWQLFPARRNMNEIPMGAIGMNYPEDEMRRLIAETQP